MNGNMLLVTLVTATAFLFPPETRAQAAATPAAGSVYTVVQGDDVVSIARKFRYPKATESQMYYAIVMANISAFSVKTDAWSALCSSQVPKAVEPV